MLVATSAWRREGVRLDATLVLARAMRAQLVQRAGVLYDSRLRIGASEPRGVVTLYLVLEGTVEPAAGAPVAAPCAWILRESEFELAPSPSAAPSDAGFFRSWGEPCVVLEICAPADRVRLEPGLALGPRPLSPATWAAVGALAVASDAVAIEHAFERVVGALEGDGVLTAGCASELAIPEPAHLARVWHVLAQVYAAQDTAAYVRALADASKLSMRQTERDLGELARRFGMLGGFRAMLRVMRLRRAILLLSVQGPSVAEVAHLVGYGSSDAMSRAFRDAGLPAPTRARAILRGE